MKPQDVVSRLAWASLEPRQWLLRAGAAVGMVICGIKFVGIGYGHLCAAGSAWIEGIGAIGIPLTAGAAVWLFRRYRVGLLVALALLWVGYVAREPYLWWVHGPDSPWPGMKGTRTRKASSGGAGAVSAPLRVGSIDGPARSFPRELPNLLDQVIGQKEAELVASPHDQRNDLTH